MGEIIRDNSESEDDWFSKDIEDFKISVDGTTGTGEARGTTSAGVFNFKDAFEDSGNYEVQLKGSKQKNKNSKHGDSEKYIHPMSPRKLEYIIELDDVSLFYEVVNPQSGFIEAMQNCTAVNDVLINGMKILNRLAMIPIRSNIVSFIVELLTRVNIQDIFTLKSKTKQGKTNVKHLQDNKIKCLKALSSVIQYVIAELDDVSLLDSNIKSLKQIQDCEESVFAETIKYYENYHVPEYKRLDIFINLDQLRHKGNTVENLQVNIVDGAYSDAAHYLHTHLGLLREDFLRPFREGIMNTCEKLLKESDNNLCNEIKLFKNVKVIYKDNSFYVCLERHPFKPFIFGSIVCLTSSGDMHDLIVALIGNYDPEYDSPQEIPINIIRTFNAKDFLDKQNLIMFESEVYFEPYYQVFNTLQQTNATEFPFDNYIIQNKNDSKRPSYFEKFSNKFATVIAKRNSLNLNEKQHEAVMNALTHEFYVIQGPPGTGKSTVGIEMCRILLASTNLQIQIVCFTNQALDQFLEAMSAYTSSIVRLGNQSKNEKLDKFNIKSQDSVRDPRLVALIRHYRNQLNNTFDKLNEAYRNPDSKEESVLKLEQEIKTLRTKIDELKQLGEFNQMKDSRIIGMTTTCAARKNKTLQLLKVPIVIVEEAAEVLESHILASLTKWTQHVILIGDHCQLRPNTSTYELSVKYKLNISLFERMIKNQHRCTVLNEQYRMRPEFMKFLTPHIYDDLKCAEKVYKYPDVSGLEKNLYFITHTELENTTDSETTKRNVYEAKYAINLADYILSQGYIAEDVVILTTYNGQLNELYNLKRQFPRLKKVKVAVVDNFQGQESKIVILSLVRSNKESNIGYLNMKNRICVALSRAREGFYLIGNMDCLENGSTYWKAVNGELKSLDAIGAELPLLCGSHGTKFIVKKPEDFENFRHGGCQEWCNYEQDNNISCNKKCHSKLISHNF